MTASPQNYALKSGQIQVLLFDGTSTPVMEDVRDWLISELGTNGDVALVNNSLTKAVYFNSNVNGRDVRRSAFPGQYIVKDESGQIYVTTEEVLDNHYSLVP